MFRFIKITVLGGIVFLIPIVVFIAVIGKALEITNKLAAPLAKVLSVDSVGELAVVQLLAMGVLVLICFIAGLAAKTVSAGKFVQWLEANILERIPVYTLLKAKTESVLRSGNTESMRSVLVQFDDSWQLAFEIERIESGKVVIFLPGSPDPWSGTVCVVTEDRITLLDLTVKSATNVMKRLGKGSTEAVRDVLRSNES